MVLLGGFYGVTRWLILCMQCGCYCSSRWMIWYMFLMVLLDGCYGCCYGVARCYYGFS